MTRATFVPETHHLTGDDAAETIKRHGRWRLLMDSAKRFTVADGTSFSRTLAHAGLLTFFPALIGVAGLAATFDLITLRNVLQGTITSLAPGPSGTILGQALQQGTKNAGHLALFAGVAAALISGTTAMAQIECAANRAYGIEEDRPLVRRYVRAFVLNITAGLMLIAALVLMAAGPAISDAARSTGVNHTVATVFAWVRWPVGIVLALGAITAIFRVSPNRHQPGWSWLVSGTVMATVLWIAFTTMLALYFAVDTDLGKTYGPLLGVIGLLLWGYFTSMALLLGLAFAAELESRRQLPGSTRDDVVTLPDMEGDRTS